MNVIGGRTDVRTLLLLVCVLALASCGLSEGVDAAEQGAVTFHERYNARMFAEMYDASAKDLRASAALDEFITAMAAIREKFGSMRATERTGFSARADSHGTFVELEYETDFENGAGTEEFRWEIADGRAKLLGYNVTSNALLR